MTVSLEPPSQRKRRKRRGLKGQHQDFASFITFDLSSTLCLALFAIAYVMMLLVLVPLLRNSSATTFEETFRHNASPSVVEAVEAVSSLRAQWRTLRMGSGATDQSLLEETIRDFEARKEYLKHVH